VTAFELVRGKPTIEKDPNAVLDYSWDWNAWLASSTPADVIQSFQILLSGSPTASTGSTAMVSGVVTAMISGGVVGETIAATCRITTVSGKIDDRTVYLKVKEK
jgi:hypothetical protein